MRHHPRRSAAIVLLGSLAFSIPTVAAMRDPSPAEAPWPFGSLRASFGGPHERVLSRFPNPGGLLYGGLIADASGALYGTTAFGGTTGCAGSVGCGTVFKLTRTEAGYTESVLYSFLGGSDGAIPHAGLIADTTGALYGTTLQGGSGNGTVFKLTPAGSGYTESVLYRFQGGNDGHTPVAGLIADKTGALYGTTLFGGSTCDCGTVFKVTPAGSGYTETVLYRFQGGSDGNQPAAGLISDETGALYGTTRFGGGRGGTVFKMTPVGSGYSESVLYRFQGGSDGEGPVAGLIADDSGALYGTTEIGGGSSACRVACGTVFKLTPAASGYAEHILYRFQGGNDGGRPSAPLIADRLGALYGTTATGGRGPCGYQCGTVFKLTPVRSGYVENVLYRFGSHRNDGADPLAGLIARKGALYGTTLFGGGANSQGTVFSLR
jgi:uncharacterized repeat protein (TIGR03803 family)